MFEAIYPGPQLGVLKLLQLNRITLSEERQLNSLKMKPARSIYQSVSIKFSKIVKTLITKLHSFLKHCLAKLDIS